MKKQDIRVMIVEDDASLGKALQQAVEKAGFTAEHFARPDDAISAAKRQNYAALLVDCMLPKMHGIELVQVLKQEGSGQSSVIMASGVFKDKNFIKDALQKTGAKHFLSKPFDLSELITTLEQDLGELLEEDKEPVFDLLSKPQATGREIRKAIESLEIIDGHDLPYIYCLLLDSGISGHLNIINETGALSGITFANGKITNVDVPDKTTFLGVLLVEKGFLSASNLQKIINTPNERRIGERLIEANYLSPHALPIVLSEQMILRLGRTIESAPVKINFVPSDVPETEPYIDNAAFTPFLHDWLFSKIKVDWVESFYRGWLDHKLQRGPFISKSNLLQELPIFEKLPGFVDFLISGDTLSHLVSQQRYPDDLFYRGLHLLVVRRVVSFDDQKQVADTREQAARLKKMAAGMEGKNYFEVFEMLGVSRKAKVADLQKAYRDFSKLYHPDRVGQTLPKELSLLAHEVYTKITRAYKILTDEQAKQKYLKEMETHQTKRHFEAEAIFEEAKSQLRRNNTKKSLELLEQCCNLIEPTTEMRLYRIWARIKSAEGSGSIEAAMPQIETDLTAIPPEDRHNATYFLVKGLYEKHSGNMDLARRNFEHAAALDSSLVEAKREFNIMRLKADNQKSQSVLNADLKDVFGMLFNKKKTS